MKNKSQKKKKNKKSFNIHAWGQRNKQKVASVICILLALMLVLSVLQI